jgi:multiple sugar transport system ATP-binding protein
LKIWWQLLPKNWQKFSNLYDYKTVLGGAFAQYFSPLSKIIFSIVPEVRMAQLHLKNIVKSFGSATVLHDIDLAIADKEFVVFVGPSGCGKSTLLRIIAGLEEASSGAIIIDGQDLSHAHPVERGISMVFQSYALYPHLSVYENIAFPLRVQKLPEAEIRARVGKAADVLQLTDRLSHKPGQLSGGQRQRVAIGRSIVREPRIFLFDEPLSNLDAALRGNMRVELSKLHRSLDATMIYVTHDQVEAMTMADRIVVLNDGHIEQFGTPMELYQHPASRFVAGFIGQPNMNFLPAQILKVSTDTVSVGVCDGIELTLPVSGDGLTVGAQAELGIRPEHLRPENQNPESLNPENLRSGKGIAMQVDVVERLGGTAIAYGTMGGQTFCASLDGNARVREGASLGLEFDTADCHLFRADGQAQKRLAAPELEV